MLTETPTVVAAPPTTVAGVRPDRRALLATLWREHRWIIAIMATYIVGSMILGQIVGWRSPRRGFLGYVMSLLLPFTFGLLWLFPKRRRAEKEGAVGIVAGWRAAFRIAERENGLTRERLLGGAIVYAFFPFFAATFTAWKHSIPVVYDFHWDVQLAALDRWLLLGVDPWRLTHALFGAAWVTRVLDALYLPTWLVQQALVLFVAAFAPLGALRRRYLLSYMLTWITAGTVLAWLFSSAGPCYLGILAGTAADAQPFAPLMQRLAEISESFPLSSVRGQAKLLAVVTSDGTTPGGGISAFPSLHVANVTLIALAARHVSRRWALISLAYACIVLVGSVHFGWHYLVDGIAGAAVAGLVWWLVGVAVGHRRLGRAGVDPSA